MFLGVDGGGTSTVCCLLGRDGRVAARVEAPSSYYFGQGIALVGRVLADGIGRVCAAAGVVPADVTYAFLGLPTYGEASADVPALDAAPRVVLGHDRYACDNDMVCGWAGSLGAADGINVVSGTGSLTYGVRGGGRGVRVGGWGELFGDEGSGYWIAVRGLQAFARMSDGRAAPGPLLDVLRERLGLAADLDLVDVVLDRWHGGRSEIAALCPSVVEAAGRGDVLAAGVLDEAGAELAALVRATRDRLGFTPEEQVPVSWSGGVFGADRVRAAFRRALGARGGGYDLRRPLYPPDVGAALYAARLAGEPFEEGTVDVG